MDLSLLIPVIALSILVERLLETGINLVEINYPFLTQNPTYSQNKQIITSLVGIALGILSAFMLNIQLFAALNIGGVNAIIDKAFTGAIAGTLAPYSHQILEAVLNLQKLLEVLKQVQQGIQQSEGPQQ